MERDPIKKRLYELEKLIRRRDYTAQEKELDLKHYISITAGYRKELEDLIKQQKDNNSQN